MSSRVGRAVKDEVEVKLCDMFLFIHQKSVGKLVSKILSLNTDVSLFEV